MKEYLLLFWNTSGEGQYDMDPEKLQEGMAAWQAWIGNIAMKGNLISTKPINWEGSQVRKEEIVDSPVIREKEMVTGYMICKASKLEEVEEWTKDCPILMNPNGYTEIREVSPFEI